MLEIKNKGTTANFLERMTTFPHFNRLIGLDDIRVLEKKYETHGLDAIRKLD
jgi:hypothetical protein